MVDARAPLAQGAGRDRALGEPRAGWRDRQPAAHFSRPGRPQYLQSGQPRRCCHAHAWARGRDRHPAACIPRPGVPQYQCRSLLGCSCRSAGRRWQAGSCRTRAPRTRACRRSLQASLAVSLARPRSNQCTRWRGHGAKCAGCSQLADVTAGCYIHIWYHDWRSRPQVRRPHCQCCDAAQSTRMLSWLHLWYRTATRPHDYKATCQCNTSRPGRGKMPPRRGRSAQHQ